MSRATQSDHPGGAQIASARRESTSQPSTSAPTEASPTYDAATAQEEQTPAAMASANTSPVATTPPTVDDNEAPPPTYDEAMAECPGQTRFSNNNTLNFTDPDGTIQFLAGNGPIQIGGVGNNRGVQVTRQIDACGNNMRTVTFGRNNGGIQMAGNLTGAGITLGGIASGNTFNINVSAANHGGLQVGGSINLATGRDTGRASNSTGSDRGTRLYRMATGQEFEMEGRRSRIESESDSSEPSDDCSEDEDSGDSRVRFRDSTRGGLRRIGDIREWNLGN